MNGETWTDQEPQRAEPAAEAAAPDWPDLASRLLDLWAGQWAERAADPAWPEFVSAFLSGLSGEPAPDRPPPAAAAPRDGEHAVEQLGARIAALEARLAALERGG